MSADTMVERDFVPCPLCKQYSHSIGDDDVAKAFRHFQSMVAHPVRGHPMGDAFDEQTRDAAQVLAARIERLEAEKRLCVDEVLNDIAVMMSEFVDNWPQPKKIETALELVAKTLRIALNPPRHKYWGAGEPDCPREIKAGNGELHTLRCKVCGLDSPRDDFCRTTLSAVGEIRGS